MTGPNSPQILKCLSTDHLATTTIQSPMKLVIESLMDALIVKYPWNTEDGKNFSVDNFFFIGLKIIEIGQREG